MNRVDWKPDSIFCSAVGAQTPVGRKALLASAAVRCGISAYGEHPFMIDRHGEPIVVAMSDWLDESLNVKERISQLAVDAVMDAVETLAGKRDFEQLPAIFALSSVNLPEESDRNFVVKQVTSALAQKGLTIRYHLLAGENAVASEAISLACRHLRESDDQAILVVAADSHLGPKQLEAIDHSGRLHSVNNSWGFTPGEGAGAALLVKGRVLTSQNWMPLAEIAAVATGTEEKLLGTETVCIGEGLTRAFLGVMSSEEKISESYCDLNGETYRADEFGFAVCRTSQHFEDAARFTAPADCWGDVGAASAILHLALATSAWSRGYAKGPVSLCWSSSAVSPLRGAIRLRNDWSLRGAV